MKKKNETHKDEEMIVIDPSKDLSFKSEEELFSYFRPQIEDIEGFYFDWRKQFKKDIPQKDFPKYEANLTKCLLNPDEALINSDITNQDVSIFIKLINTKKSLYHVAFCYSYDEEPSFIFLHFPTTSEELLNELRQRSMLLFDGQTKDVYPGAVDGDSLSEGDELAKGHYKAMLVLRNENDIPTDLFKSYSYLREESIEYADEIWRHSDSFGQNLVTFVKNFSEPESLFYIVVTLEDVLSDSNILLFSFPTKDETLVERYRTGENLQAEEVIQESSH